MNLHTGLNFFLAYVGFMHEDPVNEQGYSSLCLRFNSDKMFLVYPKLGQATKLVMSVAIQVRLFSLARNLNLFYF